MGKKVTIEKSANNGQRNIQERIEQEKVAAMLENIVQTSKGIDYRVLDELNTSDGDQAAAFKSYLSTLETMACHWKLLDSQKYLHRLTDFGHLDIYINELPR